MSTLQDELDAELSRSRRRPAPISPADALVVMVAAQEEILGRPLTRPELAAAKAHLSSLKGNEGTILT